MSEETLVYDLHCHSTYSDGTLSPEQLVERAHERGVEVLALTDHDCVAGLADARHCAEERGIRFINGVEISALWGKQTIHIVGLNINPENEILLAGLEALDKERESRAKLLAQKLEKLGIENCYERAFAFAGCKAITRTHFARLLIDDGVVPDMKRAFKTWLGRKGKAYVQGNWASVQDAVQWIVAAGGQAVIAHPARYNLTRTKLMELVKEFKEAGGVGMEVSCSSHQPKERLTMATFCKDNQLLASTGSDFHTPGIYGIELGYNLKLPYNCRPVWETWN